MRVVLPYHLRTLAGVTGGVHLEAGTVGEVLEGLEQAHPELRGTLRDPVSGKRRPLVHFFASQEDLSHTAYDAPLPDAVLRGDEPLLVIGAMAGG